MAEPEEEDAGAAVQEVEEPQESIEEEMRRLLGTHKNLKVKGDKETFEDAGFKYETYPYWIFAGVVILIDIIAALLMGVFFPPGFGIPLEIAMIILAIIILDIVITLLSYKTTRGKNQAVTEFWGRPFRILKSGRPYFLIPFLEKVVAVLPVDSDITVVLRVEEKEMLILLADEVSKKFEIEFSFKIKNILRAIYEFTMTPDYKKPFTAKGVVYKYDIQYRAENIGDGVILNFFKRKRFKEIRFSKDVVINDPDNEGGKIIVNPVEKMMEILLDSALESYGLDVTKVKIKAIDPSSETQTAIKEIQKATLSIEKQVKVTELTKKQKETAIVTAEVNKIEGDGLGDRDAGRLQKINSIINNPQETAEIFKTQTTFEHLENVENPIVVLDRAGIAGQGAVLGAGIGRTSEGKGGDSPKDKKAKTKTEEGHGETLPKEDEKD